MSKAPKSERFFIDGPAGRLEAVLEWPGDRPAVAAAVVCHPHPLHGGNMTNKVAHTLARGFTALGFAALRFNFRGTGLSDGAHDNGGGEKDDAIAALAELQRRYPGLTVWLAGFSFGAAMAVKVAADVPVDGLVSVAPAISRFGDGLAKMPSCPWLVVQGDRDELVDVDETIAWVNELEPGPELLILPGAEHFFHGRLIELRDNVTDFVQRHLQRAHA